MARMILEGAELMMFPVLLLMAKSPRDPVCVILPEVLGFWCIRSCRIYVINRTTDYHKHHLCRF